MFVLICSLCSLLPHPMELVIIIISYCLNTHKTLWNTLYHFILTHRILNKKISLYCLENWGLKSYMVSLRSCGHYSNRGFAIPNLKLFFLSLSTITNHPLTIIVFVLVILWQINDTASSTSFKKFLCFNMYKIHILHQKRQLNHPVWINQNNIAPGKSNSFLTNVSYKLPDRSHFKIPCVIL